MNKMLNRDLELKKVGLGTIIVIIGLIGLLYGPAIVSIFSLAVTSLISFRYVYGKNSLKELFSKPVAPFKNIFIYFFLNIVVSFAATIFLQNILKWDLSGNSAIEASQLSLLLILPFMILGEELFSIYFLSIFSSKFNVPIASLLSAVIFGLIHYSTYNNGNILHTLVHILLIQGVARLFFNQAAIKSNSIITSWTIHLLFDIVAILIASFFS